jgi:hypothetical protein
MLNATVIIAPSATLAQTVEAHVTVEAEYGSVVARGNVFTAAHHQPSGEFAGTHVGGTQPAPCNNPNIPYLPGATVLVSHFDLDTLGGVLRVAGRDDFFTPEYVGFWELAEFVDVNGPHAILAHCGTDQDIRRLQAFWAWGQANRASFARDAVTDLSEYFSRAADALREILEDNAEFLAAGEAMVAREAALNAASFMGAAEGIITRTSDSFVNHLYTAPGTAAPAKMVVAMNTKFGSITISLADPIPGVNCREIVQSLWGPEAGGHAGIAGSPRERKMTEDDFASACYAAVVAMTAARA